MYYLKFIIESGIVVEISETDYTNLGTEYGVAKSDKFKLGDEFLNLIFVNSIDSNGNIDSYSAIRQTPATSFLLQENKLLKKQVDSLNIAMANVLGV